MVLDTESTESLTSLTAESGLLSNGTKYYWRVRYKDSDGIYSPWSDVKSFTTASAGSGGGGGCNAGFPATLALMPLIAFMFIKRKRS